MSNRRKSPSNDFPKKSRSISFVGKDGYEILDFFDSVGEEFEYGKSGLIIELLKIYREAISVYGKNEAMFKLKMKVELDKEKMV